MPAVILLKVTVPTWRGTAPRLSWEHMWHAPAHGYKSVPTSRATFRKTWLSSRRLTQEGSKWGKYTF